MGFLGVTVSKPQRDWNRSNNGDVPPAAAPVSGVCCSLSKYLLPLCAVVTLDCSASTTSKALLSWHNGVIVCLLFLGWASFASKQKQIKRTIICTCYRHEETPQNTIMLLTHLEQSSFRVINCLHEWELPQSPEDMQFISFADRIKVCFVKPI